MRIEPYSSAFLTSGSAHARVVFPKGLNIEVNGKHILPDVLVFNGKVPDSVLSQNLPQQAFEYMNMPCLSRSQTRRTKLLGILPGYAHKHRSSMSERGVFAASISQAQANHEIGDF